MNKSKKLKNTKLDFYFFKLLLGAERKGVMDRRGFPVVNNMVRLWPAEIDVFQLWGIVVGDSFLGFMRRKRNPENPVNRK